MTSFIIFSFIIFLYLSSRFSIVLVLSYSYRQPFLSSKFLNVLYLIVLYKQPTCVVQIDLDFSLTIKILKVQILADPPQHKTLPQNKQNLQKTSLQNINQHFYICMHVCMCIQCYYYTCTINATTQTTGRTLNYKQNYMHT